MVLDPVASEVSPMAKRAMPVHRFYGAARGYWIVQGLKQHGKLWAGSGEDAQEISRKPKTRGRPRERIR